MDEQQSATTLADETDEVVSSEEIPVCEIGTLKYRDKEYLRRVPANTRRIKLSAVGGQGGYASGGDSGGPGHGRVLEATVPVTPGEVLRIKIGAAASGRHRGDGLFPGGPGGSSGMDPGRKGGGGGGATGIVRRDSGEILIVAGGAGGPGGLGGGATDGGDGGKPGLNPGNGEKGSGPFPGSGGGGKSDSRAGTSGGDASSDSTAGGGGGGDDNATQGGGGTGDGAGDYTAGGGGGGGGRSYVIAGATDIRDHDSHKGPGNVKFLAFLP